MNINMRYILLGIVSMVSLVGCTSHTSIRTAEHVDINRFMGDWFVIANIPTFIEEGAHNAVESYALNEDGSISTIFSFRKDSFSGEKKVYKPTGYIRDNNSNAIWGMQFIWPIEADYRIVYLSEDYSKTIIGRIKRDYLWIMAREPMITEEDYKYLLNIAKQQGYNTEIVRKVPQRW